MAEEGDVADFSDDEAEGDVGVCEWALLGKVLSLQLCMLIRSERP